MELKYLSKYGVSSPILFIPYHINAHKTIEYIPESDADKWPRFQKIPGRGHSLRSSEDKFLVDINNGVDEFTGMPNYERTLIIDPNGKEGMVKEHERIRLPSDPCVEVLIQKTIFPEHYKLLSKYDFLKENNFLFVLGRLASPWSGEDDIYGVNEPYRDLDYRKDSPYPYGAVIIKNLKNEDTIGKILLYDNTQISDIQNEYMKLTDSYLFITTHFRKRSTPKLTAIDIRPIKRLLLDREF